MESVIQLPPLHPKQEIAFDSPATEMLYGGATRGGKSFFARWALIAWCARIPGLQCDIFRLNYHDVISNHMQGETGFPMLLGQWLKDGKVQITQTEVRFWNSSLITLEHCADDRALNKHQGVSKHVRVFEEAPQMKERHMRWLRGWVTMSEDMKARVPEEWKGRFPRIIYTGNPLGISAGYFRRHFVKAARPYEVWQTPAEEGGKTRVYIPAKVEDNPSEDEEETRNRIAGIGDADIADALLNENWDAPIGDYFKQWDEDRHVIADFIPPDHWFKFRSFDWGSAEPFAVLWATVSDGEDFTDNEGAERWFPRGALIIYREWYGCDPKDSAKGIEMRNRDIAYGIVTRTPEATSNITVTDSLPFQDRGMGEKERKLKIADIFKEHGVPLTKANTARIHGWKLLRDRLIGQKMSADWYVPMVYVCESCIKTRDYFPALQRHKTKPEDAVESGEASHIMDAARYLASALPPIQDKPIEKDKSRKEAEANRLTVVGALKHHQKNQRRRAGRRY